MEMGRWRWGDVEVEMKEIGGVQGGDGDGDVEVEMKEIGDVEVEVELGEVESGELRRWR